MEKNVLLFRFFRKGNLEPMRQELFRLEALREILFIFYKEPLLTMFLVCMAVISFALYIVLKAITVKR